MKAAMDPATAVLARKNLYILKNWLKKLLDGDATDEYGLVIPPKFVDDESVCPSSTLLCALMAARMRQ